MRRWLFPWARTAWEMPGGGFWGENGLENRRQCLPSYVNSLATPTSQTSLWDMVISKMIHGMYLVCVFQGLSLSYVWKNMLDFCTSSKSLIANRRQDLTLIVTHHPHWTWKCHQKYIVLCKSNNRALFVDPWAWNMTHHSFSEAICFICLNFSLSNNSSEKKFQFIYFLYAMAEWHLMRVT